MTDKLPQVHEASAEFEAGPIRSRADVKITTGGLLAVGVMVTGIVLSIATLVHVATGPARLRAQDRGREG